ncbi:MAG: hypothetical protein HY547_03365 [Elusimicrobia bacterium]|nr:hypothetical protein [Elusimicrobiota bacterium]
MAETFTDKLKLSKRDTGDLNWGAGENANKDLIDQHIQLATLRPPRTLLASLGSGAVGVNLSGSTTYFYKATAFNAAGETTENQVPFVVETQVTEPSTPVPVILQWETVKGASGYRIYKSTITGQEKFLAEVTGESTLTYTDTGNTATNGAISVPAQNTARASVSKIVAGANVTISPPDGTGDVTVNASGGASPADASAAVKGITKLSVAPVVATDPIAAGDNDSRMTNARTPAGAAGGDLSGTYPNPAVAKLQGTAVAATPPSSGQILKFDGTQWAPQAAPGDSIWSKIVDQSFPEFWTTTGPISLTGLPQDWAFLRLIMEMQQTGTTALTLRMYVNDKFTDTLYWSQRLLVDGATISADRLNSPRVADVAAGEDGFLEMIFGATADHVHGQARLSVISISGTRIAKIYQYNWLCTEQMAVFPVMDLQKLELRASAGQSAGGARLRVYKLV